MSTLTSTTIFGKIKKELAGKQIKVVCDNLPVKKPNTKHVVITLKSISRNDTLEVTRNFLDDIGLNFQEKQVSSVSSFPILEIKNYEKIRKEESIRLVFKFPDGNDAKKYNIWNSLLEDVFKNKNSSLKRQPSDRIEVDVLKRINGKIEKLGNGKPIVLQIRNKKYLNVAGLVGGVGTKKADFVIVDYEGSEIGFLSYKAGSTATSFQQYSGITEKAGDKISSHPEVEHFNEIIIDNWETLEPSASKEIKSNNLKKRAVFGSNYARKSGYDSVDFLVQGNPRMIERAGIIYLTFSTKMVKKGNLTALMGDYEPVLGARKGEAYRRIKIKNKVIRGVRGGIWTKAYMVSRRNNTEL